MQWWQVYLGVGLLTAVFSLLLTFVCRRLAPVWGFVDKPRGQAHKLHLDATPVLGGPAMLLAFLATIAVGLLFTSFAQDMLSLNIRHYLPGVQTVIPELACILGGALVLTVMGLIDDRWPLDAFLKLTVQFCVAGAVACWGVRITLFWPVPIVSWAITTLWIIAVINAVNFFDNMDGLAAGTVAIAGALFALVAGLRGQHFVAVLAAATVGSAIGFLYHNRPPAKIFMGDSGSHFLGFMLAVIGALTTYYHPSEVHTPAPVLIPLLVLGIPLFDSIAVILIRLRNGLPVYVGDHRHFSHRFINMGMSRPQAVLLIYLLNFAIGTGALLLLWLPLTGVILVFAQVAAILAVVSLLQFHGHRARQRQQPESVAVTEPETTEEEERQC